MSCGVLLFSVVLISVSALDSLEWCWKSSVGNKHRSREACCWKPEATTVEMQASCWGPNNVGWTFLACCLHAEHSTTVYERARLGEHSLARPESPADTSLNNWDNLVRELASGLGPLASKYEPKDAATVLQLAARIPAVAWHFAATRRHALELLRCSASILAAETASLLSAEIGEVSQIPLDTAANCPGDVLQYNPEVALSTNELAGRHIWVDLKPPGNFLDLSDMTVTAVQGVRMHATGRSPWREPDMSLQAILDRHSDRVRAILAFVQDHRRELQVLAWELSRLLSYLSQSLVLWLLGSALPVVSWNLRWPQLELYDPGLFNGACCERYRVLTKLLTELWHDLGQGSLHYVEVGVGGGATVLHLLTHLPWLNAVLVDPYTPRSLKQLALEHKHVKDALQRFPGRAVLLEMGSLTAASLLRKNGSRFHAIFLDADHTAEGIQADLWAWEPLLWNGGLLAGHDFSWEHPGILRAVLRWRAGCSMHVAPDHLFYWHAFQDGCPGDGDLQSCRASVDLVDGACSRVWQNA